MPFNSIEEAQSLGGHAVIKCTCGAILANCRCPSFNESKAVRVVRDGCEACKALKED